MNIGSCTWLLSYESRCLEIFIISYNVLGASQEFDHGGEVRYSDLTCTCSPITSYEKPQYPMQCPHLVERGEL